MKSPRYWTVVLLFVITAVLLYHRGDADRVPYAEPLSGMPQTIDGHTSYDVPMEAEVLDVLGKGDFLNRVYVPSTGGVKPVLAVGQESSSDVPVGLFIGYFATQRTGQTIHSPQHCLPGAGWAFLSSDYTYITAANGKKYHVGEYVISDGTVKQYVLYWYQAHGRSVANEYMAKFYMIADAIRTNRTDGALVRVISPIQPNESVDTARQRVVHFTDQMAPYLNRFIPD